VVDVQADLRLVWLQIRNLSFDAIFTDLPLEEHGFILSDTVGPIRRHLFGFVVKFFAIANGSKWQ
jgi:hypothetical protein